MLFEASIIAGVVYAIHILQDENNKICSSNELADLSGDGVILSKNVELSVKQSNEHILMLAPSGAGKSRRFIMHNVCSLDKCSMIVTDPSMEIEKTCKTNKNVYIFNPFREDSIGYDPLQNCKNEFEVRKIAKVILANGMSKSKDGKQQEWVDMATPLFTSYMLMNFQEKRYNFYEMICNICTKPIVPLKNKSVQSILEEIDECNSDSAKIEFQSFLQVMGAIQTLSSIRIVLNTCLQVFADQNIKRVLCKNNLDLTTFRDKESILYIQIPERHSEYYSPLTATLVTQLFDTLLDTDGLEVYMLFDEFANIGTIPDMCKLLSTARKHNLSIVAAIQSLTQLYRTYGDIGGKELHELFKSILVMAGLKDSAEYISNLLGVRHIMNKNTTKTESLMTADEIRRMDRDKMLIICNNKRPVIDHMLPVYC